MAKPFSTQAEAHAYLRTLPKPERKIHPTVVFEGSFLIGHNVGIGAYSVIGKEGFGFDPQDRSQRWNHRGRVVIKDGVEIGANTCIDRGVLTDTIIGENTKIDNLVHVGHGAVIGKNCIIVAGTVLGGSSRIGDNCFIGMNASIKDHVTIGDNVTVGMGAVVIKDVPDNQTVVGNPAKPILL